MPLPSRKSGEQIWTLLESQGSWYLGASRGLADIILSSPQSQRVEAGLGQNGLTCRLHFQPSATGP